MDLIVSDFISFIGHYYYLQPDTLTLSQLSVLWHFSQLTWFWVCVMASPSFLCCHIWGCRAVGSIFHQSHWVVPPWRCLLVFKCYFSRFSMAFRTSALQPIGRGLTQIFITFWSNGGRLRFLILLFDLPNLAQRPVKCCLKKYGLLFFNSLKMIFYLFINIDYLFTCRSSKSIWFWSWAGFWTQVWLVKFCGLYVSILVWAEVLPSIGSFGFTFATYCEMFRK